MNISITPPMSSPDYATSESEDSSFDESYFFKTYAPLSSFPTPPLSSHSNNNSTQQSPEALLSQFDILDPNLLGPSVHLSNLIPSSTSLSEPSVALVNVVLTRANLPLETIALAVCILDCLNSRFAMSWRYSCPRTRPQASPLQGGSSLEQIFEEEGEAEGHIDSVHPEIVILCALILAVKFLDDAHHSTKEYAEEWGNGLWSCEQINATQRCIMENLGYRLLPLWEEKIINEALKDMERAGRQHERYDSRASCGLCLETKGMSDGKAVPGIDGKQLTPTETPMGENVRGTRDVSGETKTAFFGSNHVFFWRNLQIRLPEKRIEEPFPVYVDPLLETVWLE